MLLLSTRLRRQTWLYTVILATAACAAQATTTTYYNTLFAFDGSQTLAAPIKGADDALYGTTADISYTSGGLIYRIAQTGGTPQTIYQLGTGDSDGYNPRTELLLASDGYLYGTTHYGARVGSDYQTGSGTIFRVKPDGSGFETIHSFTDAIDSTALTNTDGMYPDFALIEGDGGYLYGVTVNGGANGQGVVFRISKDGQNFTVLHQFAGLDGAGVNAEGATPNGKLLLASDGRLYGVTTAGGSAAQGTIYSLSVTGAGFDVVYSFSDTDDSGFNDDGALPRGALLEVNGALYGTATGGGITGYGAVYSLTLQEHVFTTLHNFAESTLIADGAVPQAGLILGEDGRLYGTTSTGVTGSDSSITTSYGTLFAVATDGSDYEVLHAFTTGEGTAPQTELLKADATTYFGTLPSNGACGKGAVFRLSLNGYLSSDGAATCETSDSGGGGAMDQKLLLLLLALSLGTAPTRREAAKNKSISSQGSSLQSAP